MAHYDLEEQEQIDSLKSWWNTHGNLVSGVVLAVAVAAAGWQGWNWYQRGQAAQAAGVFAAFEQAVQVGDAAKIKGAAGELTEKFPGTSYAALAAMVAGKQSVESGDLKTARLQLGWVVEHGKDELRDLARLRLAAVLLDDKAYDEALKQVEAAHAEAFDARYLDLKGDILLAQGKKAEARTAYKAAQAKLPAAGNVAGEILQQKIDNLGEAA